MARPVGSISIDVTKILKEYIKAHENGSKYLNISVWENKDGKDKYGNTHYLTQDCGKEAREAGVKTPISGNMKLEGAAESERPKAAPKPAAPKAPAEDPAENDDIPF